MVSGILAHYIMLNAINSLFLSSVTMCKLLMRQMKASRRHCVYLVNIATGNGLFVASLCNIDYQESRALPSLAAQELHEMTTDPRTSETAVPRHMNSSRTGKAEQPFDSVMMKNTGLQPRRDLHQQYRWPVLPRNRLTSSNAPP
jgi:hypothetical protein